MKGKLLIIDDDKVFCELLERYFKEVYEVTAFTDSLEAARYIRENETDIVLSDLSMPEIDGMDILNIVKAEADKTDVIIMTALARVETAVEAMKKGAYDFIVKPFTTEELSLLLKNVFEKRRLSDENVNLRSVLFSLYGPENIIGESEEIKEVYRFIDLVSQTDYSVLISGESGTCKELVAKAIHVSGKRSGGKLVSVYCSTLSEESLERELFGYEKGAFPDTLGEKAGLLEEADRGTVVINEIGDMAISLQEKLLRVLQSRRFRRIGGLKELSFDGIVAATTKRDLAQLQQEDTFFQELLYSNIFTLTIPPLRKRKQDVPMLVEHYLSQCKTKFGRHTMRISKDAMSILRDNYWHGNESELQIFIAQICLLERCDIIRPEHIYKKLHIYSEELPQGSSLPNSGVSLGGIEKNLIRETFIKANSNMTEAAKLLNISYHTLRYRMKKYGLK